jgi:hypothetical protein
MGLLSGWRGRHLEPAWEYRTKGILWRLLPSADGLFAGEDRNVETKSVSFFCIDSTTGHVRWQDIRFDESWWISIEELHRDVMILHEFAAPNMPEHKRMYAIQLLTGERLWSNQEIRYLFAHEESVYGVKDSYDGRSFFELNLYTGKMIRELEGEYIELLRETIAKNGRELVEFPKPLNSGDDHPIVRAAVEKAEPSSGSPPEGIEYLERPDSLVFSYNQQTRSSSEAMAFRQHIVVFDPVRRSTIYRDLISDNARTPVPDAFFARGDFVYYVKNRNVLRAVKVFPTR